MKVKELIEKLKVIDPEMEVFIQQNNDDFQYSIVNSAYTKHLITYDDVEDVYVEGKSYEVECFIINDE